MKKTTTRFMRTWTFLIGVVLAASTWAGVLKDRTLVSWAAPATLDRLGRRTLLVIGGIGYIVSLFACSAAFLLGMGPVAAACIFLFIVSHALGQGTVIWVFIAEIFPQELRAEGQALGSFTHWLFAAILTFAFPLMVANLAPGVIFGLFGAMMVLHLLWAIFLVPETKGRRLEEIRL